ncbi:carboxylesterase/lipase family protein [Yinghuangia seranimata]|uniref:carboxylesterase/lipase family protein n=1 Tax=Yinghuangia seranimata TaxID=408067 RepID=UPI00248BC7AB|nr:carboxylesterase family protein [Yinghuangia seranimata]MDI2125578.1 carboxylesterase family protein [Yinghuangia seranimata]
MERRTHHRTHRARHALLALALAVTALLGGAQAAHAADDRGGNADGADRSGVAAYAWTDRGAVHGSVGDGYRVFSGIPYAAPPVGDLRWRPPQPAARWNGVRDATKAGDPCPQYPATGGSTPIGSEDCLYLNVTTPLRHGGLPPFARPVMVWIHGGSFTGGSGNDYPAARMAAMGDVVVVTINYRLGAFGFLAHDGLDAPGAVSGDYGIMDQQAALRWVERNAWAFGGDPGNVTLMGQSVGAQSVCANLVSPGARGLFDKAITQSFACTGPFTTHADSAAAGAATAAGLGCADPATAAACLRGKSTADLVALQTGDGSDDRWGPSAGGTVLPRQPKDAVVSGDWNKVPLLMGGTKDEFNVFGALGYDLPGHPITPGQYEGFVRGNFGDAADRVLAEYPLSAYPSPTHALFAILTDCSNPLSWCLEAVAAARFHNEGATPVWAYEFADPNAPFAYPSPQAPGYGATHNSELAYLFDQPTALTPAQRALGDTMIRYWTRFATTGDPNGRGLPAWPRYRTSADFLALAPGAGGVRTVDVEAEHHVAFWKAL